MCFVVIGAGVSDCVCRWCHGRSAWVRCVGEPTQQQLIRSAWKSATMTTVEVHRETQTKRQLVLEGIE